MSDLRALPPVHEIAARLAADGAPATLCAEAARMAIDQQRAAMLAAANGDPATKAAAAPLEDGALTEAITARAHAWIAARLRPALAPAINATGVLLHTGLGRAPLAPAAVEALAAVAAGYAPVEIDMETGQRGRRAAIVEPLLTRLTGAEAATVVNNNAAAVTIAIRAIATPQRPTVIVSRGELIEIGGAFRLPEIIEAAGAKLREVGTTNRTRLADYERAIDGETCALLKAHPSNYRIEGFTSEAGIGELARLGRARGVPVLHDTGSGVLNDAMAAWLAGAGGGPVPLTCSEVSAEREAGVRPSSRSRGIDVPIAANSIAAGADLVMFSGDKLLGGPQCGLIVGRRELLQRIERHPLMRALRADKLTLSALEATLRLHEAGSSALPLRQMLAGAGALRARAERLANALASAGVRAQIVPTEAQFGAGSAPGAGIESAAVAIEPAGSEEELAARLRGGEPRVLPRIEAGRVLLDLAAVSPSEDDELAEAVIAAVGASA